MQDYKLRMTNANSKEETKFSGKPDKGLTFEEFDKKALSWARKNYGNTYAKQLWENTLPDINSLDLTEDLDYYVFQEHCEFVYDMLCLESAKNADTLHRSTKFWTMKWQLENRQRQYEKLFCYLETICEGEAERQLHALGVEKTFEMRKHLFERFGCGQPLALQERVRKYLLAMPDKNGVAFPTKVNMPEKLDALEEERAYLLRMCPKDKHKDYDEGKETTLVRLILNALPAEYDEAVQGVRTLLRIREMIKSGNLDLITNLDDAVKINYDTSWLPPYKELRVGLVNAWMQKKRRWDEQPGAKSKEGHPTMMLSEDSKKERRCYGCGQIGHMRGAEECRAGKDAVWGGAPKAYLEKIQRKFGATPNPGKRTFLSSDAKTPCPYWSSGDGYCKFAERCKFDHSGPQGGSKRAREFSKGGKGKGKGKSKGKGKGRGGGKGKRTSLMIQRKGVRFGNLKDSPSMMVRDDESSAEDDEGNAEKELYNLMRGNTVLMVTEDSESDSDAEQEIREEEAQGSSTAALPSSVPEEPCVWGAPLTLRNAPTWGNNPLPDEQEKEFANEWRAKGRASDRRTRDEEIARGNTPPPKLDNEDFFSEGSSRKRTKPVYRDKNDITDKVEERMSSSVEHYTTGRFNASRRQRNLSPPAQIVKEPACSSSTKHSCFWSPKACQDKEEMSSEERDEEDTSEDEEESTIGDDEVDSSSEEDSDDEDDETISGIFGQIGKGIFDPSKKRERFESGGKQQARIVKMRSEYREDEAVVATRGDCVMATTEALYKLTKFDEDRYDEEDEWLVIRVPKKDKRSFFVDFCDGDGEDEFFWLEGPYRSEYLTVEDLLDRRRGQTRTARRRKGRTQFRDDEEFLDKRDKDGKRVSIFPCADCRLKGSRVLCEECQERIFPNLTPAPSGNGVLAANLNEVVKPKDNGRQLKKKGKASSTMMTKKKEKGEASPMHDMTCIGIDTCSSRSISCLAEDFLDLVMTEKDEDNDLRGIGGTSGVTGTGTLIFFAKDIEGKMKLVIEPEGSYIENPPSKFRLIGQMRMKEMGVPLTQDYDDEGTDILKCKRSGTILLLKKGNGIQLLKTFAHPMDDKLREKIRGYVRRLENANSFLPHVLDLEMLDKEEDTVLIMNEGNLTSEKYERLLHWRLGHANSKVLKAMDLIEKTHLNEDCYCCNEAKFKRDPFPKNEGSYVAVPEPYWRIYGDGFGGQNSLGCRSHGGAKGGMVFVCPMSGSIILKLYAKAKQFPAILYQVLQQIESQGFVCRELVVDTYVLNLSEAAEEVAALFRTRIIPISAGTPQELAYAERAVRTIAERSRAMLLGAPHLPNSMWGLADLNSAYVHDVLPQPEKGNKSPYECRLNRRPNIDNLHIKVFGCPCQFAPIEGAEHKRASKTKWGYYVGMQWPMVLVYSPESQMVLSVSRKKITCHEGMYAHFDPTTSPFPNTTITTISSTNEPQETPEASKEDAEVKGVHSIKVLRNSEINKDLWEPLPRPPPAFILPPTPGNQGENLYHGEVLDEDSLREAIRKIKEKAKTNGDSQYSQIVEALKKVRHEQDPNLKQKNEYGADFSTMKSLKERRSLRDKKRKAEIQIGNNVKIKTIRFGKHYAKGRPEYTIGKVVTLKGNKVGVRYEGEKDIYDTNKSHLINIEEDPVSESENVVAMVSYKGKWYKKSQTFYTIMASLEVGSALRKSEEDEEASWPKDFFEAIVRNDWREWVEAVQKENESWRTFDASEEVKFVDMERGASIIPLGELYTIKRNGQHKFRQYAMGNLLKAGKDYGDTFSSTVSGDGLRWFCSLAAACNMRIRGWDATTGYLQTKQRIKIYAYLPSHYGYSDLEFEDLAAFRKQLLKIKKTQGMKGIKEFSKRMKKERRWKPEVVLELKSSTYGIPDAGQAFAMFMQGLHIKKCGLSQCEVDPAIYYRIEEQSTENSKEKVVRNFLIAITWVDDVRYFGTEQFVKEYEESVSRNCKCTMEGDSSEFVSIEIHQDLTSRTVELTQSRYWEKAVERFSEFLPKGEIKIRRVPLSAADERLLTEPTEEEMREAEHLPYPNLLGVVQYPSAFTKPEMRYSMSVLSRHRTKWGKRHFMALIKSLEYGFSTKDKGIIYLGCLNKDDLNKLVAYADSSLSIPRSQGCRLVLMNGAIISFSSKRHSTTDDSTAAAELTEQHLCACDVEGFRNLMQEIGLVQTEPTVIYQDNQAAIQIANNRGALAKKTRAMEMRTLTVRNKVEDMKVVPVYCETSKMLADIGTKALEPTRFEALRDAMTGYGLWQAYKQGRMKDFAVLMVKMKEQHGFKY